MYQIFYKGIQPKSELFYSKNYPKNDYDQQKRHTIIHIGPLPTIETYPHPYKWLSYTLISNLLNTLSKL